MSTLWGMAPGDAQAGAKAARTRRRILDAAAAEFAQHGYAGTSLRQIAAAAGLQPGSLYFHFAAKDDLLAEVLGEAVTRSLEHVDAAVATLGPDADPAARLRGAIVAHLDALRSLSDYAAAMLRIVGDVPDTVRERHRVAERRYGRRWTDLVAAAQGSGAIPAGLDPRVVRDLLFAAMNGTAAPGSGRPVPVPRLADTLAGLLRLGERG